MSTKGHLSALTLWRASFTEHVQVSLCSRQSYIGNRYGQSPALPTISWGSLIRGGSCVQCIKITWISTLQLSLAGTVLPDGSIVSAKAYLIPPLLTTYNELPINSVSTRTATNVTGSDWLLKDWGSIPPQSGTTVSRPDLASTHPAGDLVFIIINYLYGLFNYPLSTYRRMVGWLM
jgi:hypothetical protein